MPIASDRTSSGIEEYLDDILDKQFSTSGYHVFEGKSANTVLIET